MIYFTCIQFIIAFVVSIIVNINFLKKLSSLRIENEVNKDIIQSMKRRAELTQAYIEELRDKLHTLSEAVRDTDNIKAIRNTTEVKELKLEKLFDPQQTLDMRKHKVPEFVFAMNELKRSIPNELISYKCDELENGGIRITVYLKILEPLKIN